MCAGCGRCSGRRCHDRWRRTCCPTPLAPRCQQTHRVSHGRRFARRRGGRLTRRHRVVGCPRRHSRTLRNRCPRALDGSSCRRDIRDGSARAIGARRGTCRTEGSCIGAWRSSGWRLIFPHLRCSEPCISSVRHMHPQGSGHQAPGHTQFAQPSALQRVYTRCRWARRHRTRCRRQVRHEGCFPGRFLFS